MLSYVNPMTGNPYLIIKNNEYHIPRDVIYTNTEACYWWQDKETGLTDFLFHSPLSECKQISHNHYQTPKDEGFGGRVFTLNLANGIIVDLRGPWSGGSYCANKYLPEPTIEVTFRIRRNLYIAGHMTWNKVKLLLPEGWDIIDSRWNNKHWPELVYNRQLKKNWSKETLRKLQDDYHIRMSHWK